MEAIALNARAFLLAASLIAAELSAQSAPAPTERMPQFAEYPSGSLYTGKKAPPIFRTPGQRMFRAVISEQARREPNFAGHYVVAQWGCGTGCISIAIIDLAMGTVYDGPFGRLPKAAVYLGPPPDPEATGLFFHSDSRLLIANGCPNYNNCGSYYYAWDGTTFKLLLETPLSTTGVPPSTSAQSVAEKEGRVLYEGAAGERVDLGSGHSPVLTQRGQVALIRGRKFDYGDSFDCGQRAKKNWISVVDPVTRTETSLFDRPLSFGRDDLGFCVYEQMQLSPDDSTLYLVSIVYATSGALAIISLQNRAVSYVPGVDDVYVITSGSHRGELIYQQRREQHFPPLRPEDESPYYPFVHARADGTPIRVLAEEFLDENPVAAPKLAEYLRGIGGQIIVNGRAFPR